MFFVVSNIKKVCMWKLDYILNTMWDKVKLRSSIRHIVKLLAPVFKMDWIDFQVCLFIFAFSNVFIFKF